MDYGFVRVAAITPDIRVADVEFNTNEILKCIDEAVEKEAKVAVFPELCITGYTCSDLFLQSAMLKEASHAVEKIAQYIIDKDIVVLVGFPMINDGKLYNAAAVLYDGIILGIVPKTNIPNYSEFYEARHFTGGSRKVRDIKFNGYTVPFGTNIIFGCENVENMKISVEICEDLWVPIPPSMSHTIAGATIIANLSAGDETVCKEVYRRGLVSSQSARLVCGYVYASAGEGESTTDMVFSGHNLICENGSLMAESARFINQSVFADIDVDKLSAERRRMNTYPDNMSESWDSMHSVAGIADYRIVGFSFKNLKNRTEETSLLRHIDNAPFVPSNMEEREKRCNEILTLQAMGLKKRLAHTHGDTAVIGISGGLDSTLALLVTVKAFDFLGKNRSDIIAVTMPGFGTTDRTYNNAVTLIQKLGASFREISIADAVNKHFEDIGHDKSIKDVTYENAQARQRTYLLMDIANETNGMVIGTGDMSELALGWATYNGDHMSMYGVNSSVPKTLVRHLVRYYADTCEDDTLKKVLYDVLDTPVSPELLPPKENGTIAQKTEDLVGPYELHDFFMYNVLRFGFEPAKIYYMSVKAFEQLYDKKTILKWLKVFYRRFFSQQFKRSCIPDGVKVGSVTMSPRGDLRMPSDACAALWLKQLEKLSIE